MQNSAIYFNNRGMPDIREKYIRTNKNIWTSCWRGIRRIRKY